MPSVLPQSALVSKMSVVPYKMVTILLVQYCNHVHEQVLSTLDNKEMLS